MYNPIELCVTQPVNIAHDVSFIIDNNKFSCIDDLKCDDMGKWIHKGSPKCFLRVRDVDEQIRVELVGDNSCASSIAGDKIFILKRVYYENASSPDLRKIISTLCDNEKSVPLTFIQYIFKENEHVVRDILPHGNSKKTAPFLRLKPSTLRILEDTVESSTTPKRLLNEIYQTSGNIQAIRSAAEIPRGPSDLYNARHRAKQQKVNENLA